MYSFRRDAARWVVLALLLAGWWLHLSIYSPVELGQDGLHSIGVAALPFEALIDFSLTDNHPPLYYLAIGRWLDLIGWTFATARFPSLMLGMLLIALVTGILKRVLDRRVALLGMTLLTVSPSFLTQSATSRDYILGITIAAASWLLLIVQPASRRGRLLRLAGLVVITFAGLMTWYFHLITIAAQLVAAHRSRTTLFALLAGTAAALPWVGLVIAGWLTRFTTVRDQIAHPSPLGVPFDLTAAGQSIIGDGTAPGALLILWLGLALYGLTRLGRRPVGVALGVGLAGGIASAVVVTINWGGADVAPRYYLSAALYGVPLVAVGLMSIRLAVLRAAALGVLVLAGVQTYATTVQLAGDGGPRAGLAHSVLRTLGPNDRLIFDNLEDAAFVILKTGDRTQVKSMHSHGASTWYDNRVTDAAGFGIENARGRTKWIQHNGNTATDARALESMLAWARMPLLQMTSDQWLISTYSGTSRWRASDERLGGFTLTGINVPESVPSCGKIGIALNWTVDTPVVTDYTLSVNLLHASGERLGQEDSLLAGSTGPTTRWRPGETVTSQSWLSVPAATSTGRYAIVLSLYDDNDALLVNAEGRDRIEVGAITITPCGAPNLQG